MSGNIHITSFEALHYLAESFGVFSEDVRSKIQTVGRTMERQLSHIQDRCQQLEREVSYWENEYNNADEDDDTGYLSYKRQETEEKLYQLRNLQRQAEETSNNFARCARRVNQIADERISEARYFLSRKLKELQDYASLSLENPNVFGGASNFVEAATFSDATEDEINKRINEAEYIWSEKADGRERNHFSRLFGKFAHERYQEKVRNFEREIGRNEREKGESVGEFGIEFPLKHPDGKYVYLDYVDFVEHTIIDYKSGKRGQTESDKAKEYATQRKRHIEAYKFNFGINPIYRYETYQSTINLYSDDEENSEK